MSKFLFTVWPYAGHIHPCLSLAGRLRERGHAVAFYTGMLGADIVAAQGYERFPFDALATYLGELTGYPGTDDPALYRTLNRLYTTVSDNPATKFRRVQRFLLEMTAGSIPAQLCDLTRVVKDWRPDVIVTDPMLWAPTVVLHESTGVPVVPFSFYAGCLIPGVGLAPAGFGLPPATGWTGALRNGLLTSMMSALTGRVRAKVNRVRKDHGLPPMSGTVHQHSSRMPLYLVASTWEFDYRRHDLPGSVEYAGPCLWESDGHSDPENRLPPAGSAETVYVSEGTAQVGKPFLLRPAIAALSNRDVQVVATTGLQRGSDALTDGPAPANLVVRQWVSQMVLFERTSVVITTGGSGTVRQSLWFGIPVLIAPLEWDQTENARRVVHCGAGIQISPKSCTPEVIGRSVDRLRTDSSFRENARRIGNGFRRAHESSAAVERLELLGRPGRAG